MEQTYTYATLERNLDMPIKLIALDLDGTLFNSQGIITEDTKKEIKRVTDLAVHVVISTGRPFDGIPFEQIKGLGIQYAITTNGSAIYQIPDHKCIYEDCMDYAFVAPILTHLLEKEIHIDLYIDGHGFSPTRCIENLSKLNVPESVKEYILATRTPVDDLLSYVRDCGEKIQKLTLNFYPQPDGTPMHREELRLFLNSIPEIECVCGGYNNLEFTKTGTTKGKSLSNLVQILGLAPEESMAVGDSENDISILKTAGIGVVMGNANAEIKNFADYITTSNDEDGVAKAIAHFIP